MNNTGHARRRCQLDHSWRIVRHENNRRAWEEVAILLEKVERDVGSCDHHVDVSTGVFLPQILVKEGLVLTREPGGLHVFWIVFDRATIIGFQDFLEILIKLNVAGKVLIVPIKNQYSFGDGTWLSMDS